VIDLHAICLRVRAGFFLSSQAAATAAQGCRQASQAASCAVIAVAAQRDYCVPYLISAIRWMFFCF